jgi:hypothetical protein
MTQKHQHKFTLFTFIEVTIKDFDVQGLEQRGQVIIHLQDGDTPPSIINEYCGNNHFLAGARHTFEVTSGFYFLLIFVKK